MALGVASSVVVVFVCVFWLPLSAKVAGVLTPATLAVACREPVCIGVAMMEAWPLLPVTATPPFEKLIPIPLKVTVVFGTGRLFTLVTSTTSELVKAWPTDAVCPDPKTALMLVGGRRATCSVTLPLLEA